MRDSPGATAGLYLDVNVHRCLAFVLRAGGFKAVHAVEDGRDGATDEEILVRASVLGLAVLSYNVRDFEHLHEAFSNATRDHCGIVLSEDVFREGYARFQVLVDRTFGLLGTLRLEDLRNDRNYLEQFADL